MAQALTKIDRMEITNMNDLRALGEILAKSGFFKDSADVAKSVTKVLAGAEIGIGPIASMTGIYIVQGRVTLSATLMAAVIKRSGRYNYKVKTHTNEKCVIEFFENGQPLGVSEFSKEDAQKAGLVSGDNWKKYPRNMMFARALSNGAKWYCPDAFMAPPYTPDELGATVDGETGEMIEKGQVFKLVKESPAQPVKAAPKQPDLHGRPKLKADVQELIKSLSALGHPDFKKGEGQGARILAHAKKIARERNWDLEFRTLESINELTDAELSEYTAVLEGEIAVWKERIADDGVPA